MSNSNRNDRVSNWTVFGAGVMGGLIMTVLLSLARVAGVTPMNMSMAWGTMIGLDPGAGTWIVGFIIHLLVSGLIGLIYAAAFRTFDRSGAWIGAGFGAVHWVLAGIFMGFMPTMHPMMPEQMAAPGFFAINPGIATVMVVLVEHIIYGAIVGAIYHKAAVRTPVAYGRHATGAV